MHTSIRDITRTYPITSHTHQDISYNITYTPTVSYNITYMPGLRVCVWECSANIIVLICYVGLRLLVTTGGNFSAIKLVAPISLYTECQRSKGSTHIDQLHTHSSVCLKNSWPLFTTQNTHYPGLPSFLPTSCGNLYSMLVILPLGLLKYMYFS